MASDQKRARIEEAELPPRANPVLRPSPLDLNPVLKAIMRFLPKKEHLTLRRVSRQVKRNVENVICCDKLFDLKAYGSNCRATATKKSVMRFLSGLQGGQYARRRLRRIEGLPHLSVPLLLHSFTSLYRLEVEIRREELALFRFFIEGTTCLEELSIECQYPEARLDDMIGCRVDTVKWLQVKGNTWSNRSFLSIAVLNRLPSLQHVGLLNHGDLAAFFGDLQVLQGHPEILSLDLSQCGSAFTQLNFQPVGTGAHQDLSTVLLGFRRLRCLKLGGTVDVGRLLRRFVVNSNDFESLRLVGGVIRAPCYQHGGVHEVIKACVVRLKALQLESLALTADFFETADYLMAEKLRNLEVFEVSLAQQAEGCDEHISRLVNNFMPSLKTLKLAAALPTDSDFLLKLEQGIEDLQLILKFPTLHLREKKNASNGGEEYPRFLFKTSASFRNAIKTLSFVFRRKFDEQPPVRVRRHINWTNLAEELLLSTPRLDNVAFRGLSSLQSAELETILRPFKGRITWR